LPWLKRSVTQKAFHQLHSHNLVLGPAIDGGYYLIGLHYLRLELFTGINWGTEEVFQSTVNIANKLELSIAYLPQLPDIDRPEDLPIWEQIRQEI
jgi:glycosyltransferase A (GT-A) superfamily protein (DUF2064 family)